MTNFNASVGRQKLFQDTLSKSDVETKRQRSQRSHSTLNMTSAKHSESINKRFFESVTMTAGQAAKHDFIKDKQSQKQALANACRQLKTKITQT